MRQLDQENVCCPLFLDFFFFFCTVSLPLTLKAAGNLNWL